MKKNILIIENDSDTLALIQEYINDLGHDLIATVSSGKEMFQKLNDSHPDIALMNIDLLGEMDGIELTQHIHNSYIIPFIYITPSLDDPMIGRSRIANPFGYIVEPVDRKDFKSIIEMALMRHNMERTLIENEHKFSSILYSIGDAVVVINPSDYITYVNPIAEIMTERSRNELIGKKLNEVIQIENPDIQLMKQNKSFNIGHEIIRNYMITKSGRRVPVDFSAAPRKDGRGNFLGIVMVFRDISEQIQSEEKLQKSFNQLRKTMGGIIQAMAQTVETRDPYTAGHQRRVATLSRIIAGELNLQKDIIEGISMTGVIHDLGKISIPAEILSKPGRISNAEFNLIKTHSKVGYDILKKIEFPWPVAEIVYQHHERLDGSGHPRGLSGDDIQIQARILAVADVVEAMASHRPYRPAVGIDAALDEISANKGKLYDKDVSEVCIKLFKEDGYTLDNG